MVVTRLYHEELEAHSRVVLTQIQGCDADWRNAPVRITVQSFSLYYEKKRLEKQEAEILARRLVQSCSDER